MDYAEFLYEQFPDHLDQLHAETPALWGKMNAQQMIEHLVWIVGYSNGRFEAKPTADAERLAYRQMRYFEKYVPMTHHIRQEFLPETPLPVMYPDIETAKDFLLQQLQRFDDYYAEHPRMEALHPVLGMLNYDRWVEFHARHFEHHLRQFSLLAMPVEG